MSRFEVPRGTGGGGVGRCGLGSEVASSRVCHCLPTLCSFVPLSYVAVSLTDHPPSTELVSDSALPQDSAGRWRSLIDYITGGDSRVPTPKDAFYAKLAAARQETLPKETVTLRIRVTSGPDTGMCSMM